MYIEKKLNPLVLDVLCIHINNGQVLSANELKEIVLSATFGNIIILRNYTGEPIAYALYALVSAPTLRSIEKNLGKIYFPYEWKSGRLPYVVSVKFLFSQKNEALKNLLKLKRSEKFLAFWKKKELIKIRKNRRRAYESNEENLVQGADE